MLKTKKKDAAPGSRSGLPFARAQRLQAQTARIANNKLMRVSYLSLLAIGTVVFFGAHPTASARVQGAIADAGNGAPVADVFANFNQPVMEETPLTAEADTPVVVEAAPAEAETIEASTVDREPAPVAEVGMETVVAEPAAADIEAVVETPIFVAQLDGPDCIVEIESALETLTAEVGTMPMLSEHEDRISSIVQSGLACPEAGVRVAGSPELARTDFAHLRFRWDRESRVINVATVNSAEVSDDESVLATGTTLELVFR